jgi:hypothetical protein
MARNPVFRALAEQSKLLRSDPQRALCHGFFMGLSWMYGDSARACSKAAPSPENPESLFRNILKSGQKEPWATNKKNLR